MRLTPSGLHKTVEILPLVESNTMIAQLFQWPHVRLRFEINFESFTLKTFLNFQDMNKSSEIIDGAFSKEQLYYIYYGMVCTLNTLKSNVFNRTFYFYTISQDAHRLKST